MSAAPTRVSRVLTLLATVFVSLWWIDLLRLVIRQPLRFDDAYMFYRYALHVRQGLGMSWNLDGIHTYGETSPLWGFVVVLLSYLPMSMSDVLIFGSWLCSGGAVIALAWAVARNAKSGYLSSTWRVLPIVGIAFMGFTIFCANAVTGMETMLATLLCALFVGLVLLCAHGKTRPELAGFIGILLFLVRPEAALAIVLMPVLAYLLLPGPTMKSLAKLLAVFLFGVALDLAVCKLYFGTPLPLSFYMKTVHGYEGYHASWGPSGNTFVMLLSCWPYFALLALFARPSDARRTIVCLVPAFAVFAYMCTVTQIMGFDSRYYIPYLAFIAVPGLLALDRRLCGSAANEKPFRPIYRAAVVSSSAALCLGILLYVKHPVLKLKFLSGELDHRLEHRDEAYDPVHFQVAATTPLPRHYWFTELSDIADILLRPLPKGSTIAASEVGLLGGVAPDVNVIDLAGLNDPQIALHGFRMDELLSRKPDIIWMPHTDYTYQRGVMLSDPRLLQQYDMIVGGFGYGMALRKDSPVRPLIDRQMKVLWAQLYSGYEMSDYLARSTSWTGMKHKVTHDDVKDAEAEKDRLDQVPQGSLASQGNSIGAAVAH